MVNSVKILQLGERFTGYMVTINQAELDNITPSKIENWKTLNYMHLECSENKPRSVRNIEINDCHHAQSEKLVKTPYCRRIAYKSLVNKISNVAAKFRSINAVAKVEERGKKRGESIFHAFMPKVSNVKIFWLKKR